MPFQLVVVIAATVVTSHARHVVAIVHIVPRLSHHLPAVGDALRGNT
jgi:hypothetical protein